MAEWIDSYLTEWRQPPRIARPPRLKRATIEPEMICPECASEMVPAHKTSLRPIALKLRAQGVSAYDIGRQLHRDPHTIRRWIREARK